MSKLISLTNGRFAIVDDEDFEWLNQIKWCAVKSRNVWYAARSINPGIVFMHRVILNIPKKFQTDHVDGNGLNNQRSNLRIVSHSLNQLNRHVPLKNQYGFRGISPKNKKWQAQIQIEGQWIYLGVFNTKEEASNIHNQTLNQALEKGKRAS